MPSFTNFNILILKLPGCVNLFKNRKQVFLARNIFTSLVYIIYITFIIVITSKTRTSVKNPAVWITISKSEIV